MRSLALLVLAGCSAEGVFVEVDTRGVEGVTSVELVLAKTHCRHPEDGGECPSIQGDGFDRPLGQPEDLYTRTASALTDQLDGGIATFELPAGDERIPMGFAIARGANGIVGVAVLADTIDLAAGPVIYRAALDPSTDMRAGRNPGFAAAVEWGVDEVCLGVDPLHSTLNPPRPVFILPKNNPDCDSRKDASECAPLWFDGFSFDEDTAAHCVLPELGVPGGPCLLGHVPNCVDNPASTNAPSCIQSPICLPGNLCEECVNLANVETCAQVQLDNRDNVPRVECNLNSQLDGQGQRVSCSNDPELNEFILVPDTQFLGGASCTGSAQLVTMPGATLDADRGDTFDAGTAKFKIIDVLPNCTIKMQWAGALLVGELAHTVLTIPVDTSTGFHEVWLPINFLLGGLCDGTTAPSCRYVDNPDRPDTIIQCAH